ncbi:MAG: hypothetical protein ACREBC_39210, partial [Pyrinomonadaceae bacterium]
LTSVLRLLPAWYQILGNRLVTAVSEWFATSTMEDRKKLRRWFDLSGDPLPASFDMDARLCGNSVRDLLGDAGRAFVGEASISRASRIRDYTETRPNAV